MHAFMSALKEHDSEEQKPPKCVIGREAAAGQKNKTCEKEGIQTCSFMSLGLHAHLAQQANYCESHSIKDARVSI